MIAEEKVEPLDVQRIAVAAAETLHQEISVQVTQFLVTIGHGIIGTARKLSRVKK
jgi:hypothetical protein